MDPEEPDFEAPTPAGDDTGLRLTGGDADDLIIGGPGPDTLSGGAGDDVIRAGEGNDFVVGGPGSDLLKGERGDDTLIGGGGTAEDFTVTFIFEGSTAAYENTLGHYILDPVTGQITGVGIAFADARPEFGGGELTPGTSSASFLVHPGAEVGAFLIAAGNMLNDFEALGEGSLLFLNADGSPATLDDPAPQLVHVAPDGTQTRIEGDIWHSAGYGDRTGLNLDDQQHLRGISENPDGTWLFGFEDSRAPDWDEDFTDVTFSVDLGRSGATFLNGDYVAVADLPPDDGAGDEMQGGEGDDLIFGGDGADTIAGGGGNDTIVAGPGDSVDGGRGFDTLFLRGHEDNIARISITSRTVNEDGSVSRDGRVEFTDGAPDLTFASIERIVPCFTPGTLIDTDEGRIPVEELLPGDRVLTRDRGFRTLRWVGAKEVDADLLARRPEFTPVRIARGALGNGLPERDMLVSPQHRVLITGPRAELLFGEHEVLVAAKHLVGMKGINRAHGTPVTYVHIMADRHEIVRSDGLWSESFQPGDMSLAGLDRPQREELLALFPELQTRSGQRSYTAARMSLRAHEARALLAM